MNIEDMTLEEKVEVLNNLQAAVSHGRKLSSDEKGLWKKTCVSIKSEGYALGHRREGSEVVWFTKVPRQRHFTAELVKMDMRPPDGKPTRKGDCTTRAMAYCLQGVASYREIESEQYRLADELNTRRNTVGTWDRIMRDLGYVWVGFRKTVRRDNLARMLCDVKHPIIFRSSGHVAVIDNGKVIDSWDSRHGRCMKILVESNDLSFVKEILGSLVK